MKRIILALAALSLAACGTPTIVVNDPTTPAPAPTVTVTQTPVAAPEPVLSDEDQFLEAVHSASYTGNATDATLLETGEKVCEALDRGVDPYEIIAMAVTSAEGDDDITEMLSAVIAGAVVYLCPQHQGAMERAVG